MKYEIDLHLFSKKILSIIKKRGLVDKNGKPDKIAFFNILYPSAAITDEECSQDRQKVTDTTRTVDNWLKGKNYPKRISDILHLCNSLGCDLDYFFTDMDAPTHDLNFISKETGLSSEAIEKICNYSPQIKELINRLILNSKEDNLLKLLQAIQTYALYAHHSIVSLDVIDASLYETQDIEDKLIAATSKKGNTLPDISKRMLRYTASTAFDEVLLDTYNDYIEDGNTLLQNRINENAEVEKKRWTHIKENYKCIQFSPEDLQVLYCGAITNQIPSQEEAFKIIDEKAKYKYEQSKEEYN